MIDLMLAQVIAVICALAALGVVWTMDRQGIRHANERELWRAERQILQARALKPMPSSRRPSAPADTEASDDANARDHKAKLAELRRLAGVKPMRPEEPVTHIVPTDL